MQAPTLHQNSHTDTISQHIPAQALRFHSPYHLSAHHHVHHARHIQLSCPLGLCKMRQRLRTKSPALRAKSPAYTLLHSVSSPHHSLSSPLNLCFQNPGLNKMSPKNQSLLLTDLPSSEPGLPQAIPWSALKHLECTI